MATKALSTRRSERSVGMPSCGLGLESTRPEGKPGFAYLGADVRGINAVSDVQSWEKQAHNPVGVTSS